MTGRTNEVTGTSVDLTESQRHRMLAVERRRTTLEVLEDLTAPVDLEDLAVAVAEREADGDRVDEGTVEQVRISLHHAHLPKLADLGIIAYDPVETRVEARPRRPSV